MADIFLSYSSKDRERVKPLVHALEREGWTVWWDRKTPAGETFDRMLERELAASRCVVVVWSVDSILSRWVREEAEDGREKNRLFPVKIDHVTIPLGFRLIQAVDLVGWTGYSINPEYQHLVQSIMEKIGRGQNSSFAVKKAKPFQKMPDKSLPFVEKARPVVPPTPEATNQMPKPEIRQQRREEPGSPRETSENQPLAPVRLFSKILLIAGGCVLVGAIIMGISLISDEKVVPLQQILPGKGKIVPNTEQSVKESTPPPNLTNRAIHSINIPMIDLPGGEFQMGGMKNDEKPVHLVKVAPFSIGKYEVTQAEWEAVMVNNPSHYKGDTRPVENVSWNDVQEFLKKIGNGYRLPTEAEWEYAARGGTTSEYSFVDDESKLGDYAWFGNNSGSETHPVGKKKANPFGLFDVHGNVWEWCQDQWHASYNGAPNNAIAWEDGDVAVGRVLRGGGWYDGNGACRLAFRIRGTLGRRDKDIGFRLSRTLQ